MAWAIGFDDHTAAKAGGSIPLLRDDQMINELTGTLRNGGDLSEEQVKRAVVFLTSDYPGDAKAEFLRALSRKGETAPEIAAFASAFLDRALPVEIPGSVRQAPVIDVCGTGGDQLGLINVSTTVALILAAGGAVVVKHGNRGVSSRSGGADVLEALGVKIDLDAAGVQHSLEAHRFGFIFAQRFHPTFKALASVRRQLAAEGVVTVFNLLGPLLNPAKPDYQLVGLFRGDLLRPYAEVLGLLGRRRAWVVNGHGGEFGMDEISTLGPTNAASVENGTLREFVLSPTDFGLKAAAIESLKGGAADENALIVRGILGGDVRNARRDIVVANAAAAFVVCGMASDLSEGVALAGEILDSRSALHLLDRIVTSE